MALSNNNIGACLFYDLRHNCLHYTKYNDPIREKYHIKPYAEYAVLY